MISKKAQSEVITTVLIILLVLAAIIIVWQVVQSTVGRSSQQASSTSDCMNAGLTVGGASNSSSSALSVSVNRGGDTSVILSGLEVLVYDSNNVLIGSNTSASYPTTAFGQLSYSITASPVLAPNSVYTIKVAPILKSGKACDPLSPYTFSIP